MAEVLVLQSEAEFPFSNVGLMRFQCYKYLPDDTDFVVLIAGDIKGRRIHLRLHDACLTSEVFGSCKCDCRHQLVTAQKFIGTKARLGGGGLIVYTFQEGRGIGLANKIAAYALQERLGLDTVQANEALGLPVENRVYDYMPALLARLGVESVILMTNNPFKKESLTSNGVCVESMQSIVVDGLAPEAAKYLETKGLRMGHILGMEQVRGTQEAVVKSELSSPIIAVAPCPMTTPIQGDSASAWLLKRAKSLIEAHSFQAHGGRPFVTLSFAQSLDGSIATLHPKGKDTEIVQRPPLLLSGQDSMTMTHGLRALVRCSLSLSLLYWCFFLFFTNSCRGTF
mmetsp:Transcript_34006/g.67608  ORF Transcript_34006/g.67608 Transcript_34006/m.67608 type:complete len:340 (+) Transcript_34006:164-1183(+)